MSCEIVSWVCRSRVSITIWGRHSLRVYFKCFFVLFWIFFTLKAFKEKRRTTRSAIKVASGLRIPELPWHRSLWLWWRSGPTCWSFLWLYRWWWRPWREKQIKERGGAERGGGMRRRPLTTARLTRWSDAGTWGGTRVELAHPAWTFSLLRLSIILLPKSYIVSISVVFRVNLPTLAPWQKKQTTGSF